MAKKPSPTTRSSHWDPLASFQDEQPSVFCLRRVKKDIMECFAEPPAGLLISPEEHDVTIVYALIIGPAGTPYEGGFFQFLMKFPPDYPMSPPRVRFMTTDSGRVRFNPNLYANGKVCLSILGTWLGQAWSPAQCLESVLLSIQSLFNEEPYYNKPGTRPRWLYAYFARGYNDAIQHETIRVAVCDMVEASLDDSPQCPQAFRKYILKSFLESYEKYENIAKKNSRLTGTSMGAFSGRVFEYGRLVERLKGLKTKVENKVQNGTAKANQ